MKCVKLAQQPDGSYKLIDDIQTDLNQCEFVLQSGFEAGNSLTSLTPAQGLEIGGLAGGVLAIAWGFKKIASLINESEISND